MDVIVFSSAGLFAVAIAVAALLKGWHGWLDVKRLELTGSDRREAGRPWIGRPELSDLKERIRRLEAIANGTEL